jgi:hypothetical protein
MSFELTRERYALFARWFEMGASFDGPGFDDPDEEELFLVYEGEYEAWLEAGYPKPPRPICSVIRDGQLVEVWNHDELRESERRNVEATADLPIPDAYTIPARTGDKVGYLRADPVRVLVGAHRQRGRSRERRPQSRRINALRRRAQSRDPDEPAPALGRLPDHLARAAA